KEFKSQHNMLRELLVPHIRAYMDAKARGQLNFGIADRKQKHVRAQLTQIENTRQTIPLLESVVRFGAATKALPDEAPNFTERKNDQASGLLTSFRMQADIPLSHQGTINDLTFNHAETVLAS